MKSFTDLEQSKKLAEILPVESADMVYIDAGYCSRALPSNDIDANSYPTICQCWSLSALLDILYPNITLDHTEGEGWSIITNIVEENPTSILQDIITEKVIAETPIDACVEIILKLKEKDLL